MFIRALLTIATTTSESDYFLQSTQNTIKMNTGKPHFHVYRFGNQIFVIPILVLVPIEYQNAVLYAITPKKQCVGIKIFAESVNVDENSNSGTEIEQYIDRCVEQALEMKSSVEDGSCDIETNAKIILNPRSKCVDMDVLVSLQSRCKANILFDLLHL